MKQLLTSMLVLSIVIGFILPMNVFADAAPGDEFVTLGKDLSPDQKSSILDEMGVDEDVDTTYVTNQEEHEYLGDYISDRQIGTRAISSAKVTLQKEGEGVDVDTHHITYVSDGMYANALVTAGVKDANVYVTAPFDVSGTAALTGILKAYDEKTDQHISKKQKKVANEELVRTSQLGNDIGKKKATELVTRVKEKMAKNKPKSEEDVRKDIDQAAEELNVNLTKQQKDKLVILFVHIKNLNIDWGQVKGQLGKLRDNLDDLVNDPETQSFLQKVFHFLGSLVDKVKALF